MSHQLIEREHCSRCGESIVDIPWERPCRVCGQYVFATQSGVRVDKRRLVVRPGVTLPERCAFTNTVDDLQARTVTLKRRSSAATAGLLGPAGGTRSARAVATDQCRPPS